MITPITADEGHVAAAVPTALRLLTRLIERDPEAPIHHLLRGEAWLVMGDREAARADLERARQTAAEALANSAWGYLYQGYVDRAEAGLRQCG